MSRRTKLSPQTLTLLNGLAARITEWRYGYDLTRELGLKSGTLYPLLMRLTDEGLLESEWRPAVRPGLPARHAYRITAAGIAAALAAAKAGDAPENGGLLPV
jgi:DNA-binding PadR family transcriptional regulator